MSIFKLILPFLAVTGFSCTIDLTPYLNKSFEFSNTEVGAHPVILDYSYKTFNQTFAEFIPNNDLQALSDAFRDWFPEFIISDRAEPWKLSGYKFGIFDGCKATHKKERLIKGINCKMSREFIDWIRENKNLSKSMERFLNQLDQIDTIAQKQFSKVIKEIGSLSNLYNENQHLPITIRLIRFDRTQEFTLPLHFDISVLSLVFPSNDIPFYENFVMSPADGRPLQILDLRRALRPVLADQSKTCGLIIAGSQVTELAPHIYPSPHGVLPNNQGSRCVIVACLHLPNCDTSQQNTLLPKLKEVPSHLLDPIEEMGKMPSGALIVLDIGNTLVKKKETEWVLTDERWPLATNRAEKVIALTCKPQNEEISQSRKETLKMLGIACTIVECDSKPKGPHLAKYIKTLKQNPTMILYVDDKLEQIESVNQTCKELGIQCKSIHYIGGVEALE